MYLMMTHPWEMDGVLQKAEETFRKIKVPFYTGSRAYAYTYKLHWQGAQHYFQERRAPKKLLFNGRGHVERPFHQRHVFRLLGMSMGKNSTPDCCTGCG